MKIDELKACLKSSKYGFPYFRQLLEKGLFFNSSLRTDIERRDSNTLVFKNSIADVFAIRDNRFKESYDAVVNGEGNEKKKICSLRSSSLLGLLAFYKVHSGHRIELERVINGNIISFVFDEVVFEKTNRVFHPSLGLSSIDVALYGTANGVPCVLYLESKFTEYLEGKDMLKSKKDGKDSYPISLKYSQKYKELLPGIPGIEYSIHEKGICLRSNDKILHYCEGIKQMISHYIGAVNSEDRFKGLEVYLGTILFDFSSTDCNVDPKGMLIQDYSTLYSALAKKMNNQREKNLTVIEEVWTYQDIFSKIKGYELDPLVKEYYQL